MWTQSKNKKVRWLNGGISIMVTRGSATTLTTFVHQSRTSVGILVEMTLESGLTTSRGRFTASAFNPVTARVLYAFSARAWKKFPPSAPFSRLTRNTFIHPKVMKFIFKKSRIYKRHPPVRRRKTDISLHIFPGILVWLGRW